MRLLASQFSSKSTSLVLPIFFGGLVFALCLTCAAQSGSIVEPESDRSSPNDVDLDKVLTGLVLKKIPHRYVKDKDWGTQEKRWDGIKWRREGWKIETKRKWKTVNHGTWKKYSAEIINPETEFGIELKNVQSAKNGDIQFDLHFTGRLRIDGRQSKWVKGVQLYSISAEGHAKLRVVISCIVGFTTDPKSFPPDIILNPTATSARIIVDEFRIDRISKAGGEFAQQMTKQIRKVVDEKIEEKEVDLIKKINKEIEKNKDDLRISVAQGLKSKWFDQATDVLPIPVLKALKKADRK